MASTPEGRVKDKIKKILKEHNIYYAMPHGAGYGSAGVPDFLCCVKGKFVAVETKAHDNSKVTALQLKQLQDIEAAGGETFVIHSANIHFFEIWAKENA